jgi:glycosyltransferase involved in cell wall biosynthesis
MPFSDRPHHADPRVSVIMPVYNGEAYLAEAIESVLEQTLGDLELIVVDDGSEDGTRAIVTHYAREDRRVKAFFNQQNAGLSEARNLGWRMARAPYLAMLDADDIALPHRLSRQADFLDAHPPVAAVGASAITVDATGRHLSTRRFPTKDRAIRSTLLRHNCMGVSSVTMRRAALAAVGGYRFRCVEDYDLWLRLSERFELANLTEPLILSRLHVQSHGIRVLETDARSACVICAAARTRRATGIDPLRGVQEITLDLVARLQVPEAELRAYLVRELIARAAIFTDLGDREAAHQFVTQATELIGCRAERAVGARLQLKQAERLMRKKHPGAAIAKIILAFKQEPRHTASLMTEWLGPRVPGGHLLRWT